MNNDFRPTPTYSAACAPKGDSVILEVLALAARPDVISFAGGLPSPEGFPVKEIAKAAQWVLDNHAVFAAFDTDTAAKRSHRRIHHIQTNPSAGKHRGTCL